MRGGGGSDVCVLMSRKTEARACMVQVCLSTTALTLMSSAWPWAPPIGWWIMTRELGSAMRWPLDPAASRKEAIEAASPTLMVTTCVNADRRMGIVRSDTCALRLLWQARTHGFSSTQERLGQHLGLDVVHRVKKSQSSNHGASGAVDVEVDRLRWGDGVHGAVRV